jgi:hypothetical protein
MEKPMTWDHTENPTITRTRLRLSSPESVYQALEEYGAYLQDRPYSGDKSLEQILAARADRLIDLALARNASSSDLVAQLYARARAGTEDADYDRAVRLACLSNRIAVSVLTSHELNGTSEQAGNELRRLATEGDADELTLLLRNPESHVLFEGLYARKAPFLADISDERWRQLVASSIGNPSLNRDESSIEGPDLSAWRMHKALFTLLTLAPAEPQWVLTLHSLLLEVNPARVRAPDSEQAALDTLTRWHGVTVMRAVGNREHNGYYTPLPLAEEFRCLIAALYGRIFANDKSTCIGKPDAQDVALRCAYYGCEEMEVAAMKAARNKDGDIFSFAALFNNSLLLNKECRAELEGYINGDTQWLYRKRCVQMHDQYRWFDVRPVSESFEIEESDSGEASGQTLADLRTLPGQMTELKSRFASLAKTAFWGLVVLAILVVWRR